MEQSSNKHFTEVFLLFLKLGFTAFGGPAAHVGIMHDEVVVRRKWVTDEDFLDLMGATNLIPGPNSTEMAIHLGYARAGWPGLILGGIGFIFPAVVMVLGLAWAYVRYGSTPQAEWLLYGVKPVVIAIIIQALWILGRKAVKSLALLVVFLAVIAGYLLGVHELLLLAVSGFVFMTLSNLSRLRPINAKLIFPPFLMNFQWLFQTAFQPAAFSLPVMFLTFLKIGSVLYGSGYVLVAFLQADFVERLGWLTTQQLIDAVAIGQVTPGPVFTTATFLGYIFGGVPGGLLATLGIFLPSFLFVAVSNPFIPKIRNSVWLRSVLDGVNAASLGLMAAVTWTLGRASLIDFATILVAVVSLVLLLRYKVNSTWLIAGGALLGYITSISI